MSNVMDRKVVEMQFDNSQFERNVRGSIATLDNLKESLKFEGVSKSIDEINRSTGKLDFSGMRGAIETVTYKFSVLESIALGVLFRIGEKAADAGIRLAKSMSIDNIASGWSKYEEKTRSVGTLIAQGFDMSVVNEQLDRLNWYTDETSYSFTNMVAEIAKFTATGKGLEESVDALMGIANWAAVSGQNASTASRAMYQLSQAMGSGVMRKEDYKSIQNVSMDTAEFRQKALDAGVALGTLKKNADGTYQSIVKGAKSSKFNISQFADHLTQDAWFTSDVMMAVYKDYGNAIDRIYTYSEEKGVTASQAIEELSDELDEFGVKAFKAAQEARSWNDTVESVKEAVASGFMQTFEIFFGQYDDAVDLWTDLANRFYDIFAQPINDFNSELRDGLQGTSVFIDSYLVKKFGIVGGSISEIIDLIEDLGYNSEAVINKLNGITNGNEKLNSLIVNYIRLNKLSNENDATWRSGDIASYISSITDASEDSIKILLDLVRTNKELLKTQNELESAELSSTEEIEKNSKAREVNSNKIAKNKEDIEKFLDEISKGDEKIKDDIVNLIDLNDSLNKLTGYRNLLESFSNVWDYLASILSAVKSAFDQLFPSLTADRIYEFTKKLKESTDRLSVSEETLDKITRAFKGIFSLFRIVGQAISPIIKPIKAFFEELIGDGSEILEFSAYIGDAISSFAESGKVGKIATAVFERIANSIRVAVRYLKDFLNIRKAIDRYKSSGGGFVGAFVAINDKIKIAINGMAEFIESLTGLDTSKFVESINRVFGKIENWLHNVRYFFRSIFNRSDDEEISKPFERVLSIIDGIRESAKKVFSGIKNVFGKLGEAIKQSSLGKILHDILSLIVRISLNLGEFLAKALDIIGEKLNDINFEDVLSFLDRLINIIGLVIGGAATLKFIDLVQWFAEIPKLIRDATMGFASFFEGIGDTFDAFRKRIEVSTLKKIALSLLALAVALVMIAAIPAEKLDAAVFALGNLAGVLVGVMASIKGLNDGSFQKKAENVFDGKIFLKIAASLLILAVAVRQFKGMDEGEIKAAVAAIIVLMTAMVLMSEILGRSKNMDPSKISKSMAGMIFMAVALRIVVSSVKSLSKLEPEKLKNGMVSTVILISLMVIAAGVMSKFDKPGKVITASLGLISFAIALRLILWSVKSLSKMDPDKIAVGIKAVIPIITVMVAAAGVMSKFDKSSKVISSSIGMIAFATALRIVISSVKELADMTPKNLKKSIIGVTIIIGEMVVAAGILSMLDKPRKAITAALGLILLAAALKIIVSSVRDLSNIAGDSLKKGLIAVTALLTELVAASVILSQFSSGKSLTGAAGILAVVLALSLLVPVMKTIATMTVRDIVKALAAFAAVIAIVVVAGYALQKVSKSLLTGAAAMALFGAGVALLGAGLQLIATALGSLGVGIKLFFAGIAGSIGTIVTVVKSVLTGLIELIPLFVTKLGEGLMGLLYVISRNEDTMKNAFLAILGALLGAISEGTPEIVDSILGLILGLLDKISERLPELIDKLSEIIIKAIDGLSRNLPDIIKAGFNFVKSLIEGLIEALADFKIDNIDDLGKAAANLLEIMLMLGAMSLVFPFALAGVLGLGTIAVALTGVIVALGALSKIPGISDLISAGGGLLGQIGTALGQFVGGFLGAVTEGVASVLPDVADSLSEFAMRALPFITVMKMVDSSVLDGAISMAGAILAITAADVISQIAEFFGADTSFESLGDKFEAFGQAMVRFSEATAGLNAESFGVVAEAASHLVGLAQSLPSTEGLWGWISGKQDLGEFGSKLGDFATGLVSFAESARGISEEDCTSMINVANAMDPIVTLSKKLPNTEGAWGWIGGKQDLGEFGAKLGDFAAGLSTYATEAAKISDEDLQHITSFVNVIDPLVDISKKLPNTEGAWGWLSGKQDLGEFGDNLTDLGSGVANFASSIKDVNYTDIAKMQTVSTPIESLVDMAVTIGGVGDVSKLKTFSKTLDSVASNVKSFVNSWLKNIKSDDLSTAVNDVNKIVDLANSSINGSSLTSLARGIDAMAGASISGFVEEFENSGDKVRSVISSFLSSSVTVLRNKYRDFYSAGSYVVNGFVNGMKSVVGIVDSTSRTIGKVTVDALNDSLEINSPSKEADESGRFFGLGFINGLSDTTEAAGIAASEVGDKAIEGLRKSIDGSLLTGELDNTITIKPVLDLSEIQNGAGKIDGMLGGLNDYAVAGSMSFTSSASNSMSSRGADSEEVNSIEKLTEVVKGLGDKLDKPVEQNNSFNFYGPTNDEIVREVKKTLSKDIIKEGRRWA